MALYKTEAYVDDHGYLVSVHGQHRIRKATAAERHSSHDVSYNGVISARISRKSAGWLHEQRVPIKWVDDRRRDRQTRHARAR